MIGRFKVAHPTSLHAMAYNLRTNLMIAVKSPQLCEWQSDHGLVQDGLEVDPVKLKVLVLRAEIARG